MKRARRTEVGHRRVTRPMAARVHVRAAQLETLAEAEEGVRRVGSKGGSAFMLNGSSAGASGGAGGPPAGSRTNHLAQPSCCRPWPSRVRRPFGCLLRRPTTTTTRQSRCSTQHAVISNPGLASLPVAKIVIMFARVWTALRASVTTSRRSKLHSLPEQMPTVLTCKKQHRHLPSQRMLEIECSSNCCWRQRPSRPTWS